MEIMENALVQHRRDQTVERATLVSRGRVKARASPRSNKKHAHCSPLVNVAFIQYENEPDRLK